MKAGPHALHAWRNHAARMRAKSRVIDVVSSISCRRYRVVDGDAQRRRIASTTRLLEQPAHFNSRLASAPTCFNADLLQQSGNLRDRIV
jgi:hypothetical protein